MLPLISVFLTSIRPWKWADLHANIKQATSHPFEVVVTTPSRCFPTGDLPKEFVFIETDVKPAQALEAAACKTRGDYIVQSVDDVKFDPGAFDKMLDVLKEPKTIASCVYWIHGVTHMIAHTEGIFGNEGGYPRKADNNPIAPICPMLRKMDWEFGTDPRFGAQYGELDLYFRLIAGGWRTVLVDAKVIESSGGSDLWRSKGQNDLRTLRSLWRDADGQWTTDLRKGASMYDKSTILRANQGQVW